MLTVPTTVGPSAIHGVGLFAASPIKSGTRIWEYHPTFDLWIQPDALDGLPAQIRRMMFSHGYLSRGDGSWNLNLDNARFSNHSFAPNADPSGDFMIANRAIAAGEEITSNYFTYCASNPHQPWLEELRAAAMAAG